MSMVEENIVEVDLSRIHSQRDLRALVAESFHLSPEVSKSWELMAEALANAMKTPQVVRLRGLRHLEDVLPEGARAMLRMFGEHNDRRPTAACSVVVDDDYQTTIYFLQFEARRTTQEPQCVEGAYVNCWIKSDDEEAAMLQATESIEAAGWEILALEEARRVTRDEYSLDDPGREYFEQALVDGTVFVFHTWEETD